MATRQRTTRRGFLARSFTIGAAALVIECVARGDGQLPTILAEVKRARQFVEELVKA